MHAVSPKVVALPRRSEVAGAPAPSLLSGAEPTAPLDGGRLPWTALALAAGLHAALLGFLFLGPLNDLAGTSGHQLDAITVTIVNSNVLEALSSAEMQSTPLPPEMPLETVEGSSDLSSAAPEIKAPERPSRVESAPVASGTEPLSAASPEAGKSPSREDASPAAKGGVTALVETGDAPTRSASPAAASPGAVREYARYVSQALAKTKPKGAGRSGTVKIRLELSSNGKLAAAEIAKSSGSRQLDDMALEAVRRTRFPAPPAGMSAGQLTYEVPYHFR